MDHTDKPDYFGLNTYIFAAYTLLIVYVSLSPFTGWRIQESDVFHFFTVWPRYITSFDVLINIFAYFPLGFLAALSLYHLRGVTVVMVATGIGVAISLSMETLQVFVPGRVASVLDLLTNMAGSLAGATLAQSIDSRTHLIQWFVLCRKRWFLPDRITDYGLILLGLWLFIQTNPSLPLMGLWSVRDLYLIPTRFDVILTASILLNTLVLGMLLSLILQPDRSLWVILLTFLAACTAIKWVAAVTLLKPDALFEWLSAESLVGIGYATVLLLPMLRLRLHARIGLVAACLIAGIVLSISNADDKLSVSVLQLFDWHHGQYIPNFNSLTRLLAELWAILMLLYLLVLYRKKKL